MYIIRVEQTETINPREHKMIRVTEKNAEKITAAIDNAQSKARVRTICRADIRDAIEEIEKNLSRRLYKKDWLGLTFGVDVHGQSFPGAYKGTPESTRFSLVRRSSGWFVDKIVRGVCDNGTYTISFADKADALAKFASQNF